MFIGNCCGKCNQLFLWMKRMLYKYDRNYRPLGPECPEIKLKSCKFNIRWSQFWRISP